MQRGVGRWAHHTRQWTSGDAAAGWPAGRRAGGVQRCLVTCMRGTVRQVCTTATSAAAAFSQWRRQGRQGSGGAGSTPPPWMAAAGKGAAFRSTNAVMPGAAGRPYLADVHVHPKPQTPNPKGRAPPDVPTLRMLLYTQRPHDTALTMDEKLSSMMMMSAASFATSVPTQPQPS